MKRFTPLTFLLTALLLGAGFTLKAQCTSGDCSNGYGTYTYTSGDKYTGYFADGKRNGQGTYYFSNGNKYVGDNKDDYLHGYGTFTFTNGSRYEGQFAYGVRSGSGTFYWANGDKYMGSWANDKMNGQGTFTYADGSTKTGYWKNDSYVGTSDAAGNSDDFCSAMDKIREDMDNDFGNIKGAKYWDEKAGKNYWSTTVNLPGSDYSDIEDASSESGASAYYQYLKTNSYSDAKNKFDEIKSKMEGCKPADWYDETDDDFSDEALEYLLMDESYYDFGPGKYISLALAKDKTDGYYYVDIMFATSKE
jgi:hypothetical protein